MPNKNLKSITEKPKAVHAHILPICYYCSKSNRLIGQVGNGDTIIMIFCHTVSPLSFQGNNDAVPINSCSFMSSSYNYILICIGVVFFNNLLSYKILTPTLPR